MLKAKLTDTISGLIDDGKQTGRLYYGTVVVFCAKLSYEIEKYIKEVVDHYKASLENVINFLQIAIWDVLYHL